MTEDVGWMSDLVVSTSATMFVLHLCHVRWHTWQEVMGFPRGVKVDLLEDSQKLWRVVTFDIELKI
jgi:hypothetical protein